jgi:hypothetical protein
MTARPIRASLVAITSLAVIGCTTPEERRQKLLDRRAMLIYQPDYMRAPDSDWSNRSILSSRELAVAEIDHELAELDREEAERAAVSSSRRAS